MKTAGHILLKLLKWLSVTALVLVLLVAGAAVAVLNNPKLVLNEKNLRWAASQLRDSGLRVEWEHLDIGFDSRGWLEKRFDFDFAGLCVAQKAKGASGEVVDACFERARFGAVVSLKGFKFRLPEVGPIDLDGRHARVDLTPAAQGTEPKEPETDAEESSGDLLPSFLKDAKLLPVKVSFKDWNLKMASGTDGRPTGWKGKFAIQGSSDAADEGRVKLGLKADGQAYGADPKLKLKPAAEIALDVRAGFDGIRGKVDAVARDLLQSIPEGRLKGCAIDLARKGGDAGHLALDCPVTVRAPLPPKKYERFKLPVLFGARITADLDSSTFPPAATSRLDGKLRVLLDPILHPIFEGKGDIRADLAGVPARFPKDWKADTDFDLSLVVPKFQRAVTELEKTPWTVPAPFAVMKGSMEFAARGKLNLEKGEVPLTFKTRMGSRAQVFNLDGQGALHLTKVMPSPEGKLDFELILSDVMLALPHLKMEAPPRFVPDGRIRELARAKERERQQAAVQAGPGIAYGVVVRTPDDKPLRLLTNLAQKPVPIELKLALASDSELGGRIAVVPFDIEAFRRKARIERFIIDLIAPSEESEVDGAISVAYADYTVTIRVINTLGRPVIKLASDPPLPEDQLWATLLFGAPLEGLDSDQAASVGAQQAAVTDGAIGLASLYALASTPVERVGYDSTTGMFSAKVKLGQGTSLNVGSTGDGLGQVGVRRRLSKHWAINTDLLNPADTSERSASAFLEWSYKY